MSAAVTRAVEQASDRLADALDRMDADAIFRASDELAAAIAALRAEGGWRDAHPAIGGQGRTGQGGVTSEQLAHLSRRIGAIRRRVNLMTDHARAHVDALTLLGARVPPMTYAARR